MQRDSDDVFEPAALRTETPWEGAWSVQGVIQVLGPMVSERRKARLTEVFARRTGCVTVLLDAPHDPHNGAAVLRSCDAFGVQEVHVIPRSEKFLASNLVAKGAERWVDVVEHAAAATAAGLLTERGFELVATHPDGKLLPEDLVRFEKVCLVLGNERDGISEELASMSRQSVRIPMVGFVESLNVSVSAAILLRAATHGRPGDLTGPTRERLLARGLYHSVPRASEILAALAPR
jgi:tRNA (guanosine-2'-O-)-methyltransferase